jgi:transglutaminase-like putative cysteine protease
MDLRITHETVYDYTPAVETAQHVAYLQPLNTPCQTLLSHQLDVFPTPALLTQTTDIYGNQRTFFSLQSPHTQLRVVATSEVRTRTPQAADSTVGWETLREGFRYHTGAAWNPATEFSFASVHAPRHDEFSAYARPSFGPGVAALAGARDLMARIHADFTYEAQSTEVNTPALEALAQRKGVCQDFAHIMIACLRAMGLAARYVSGYLLTQPPPGQPRLVGSDASHAWVAIYLPDLSGADEGHGWYDLDPTNDRDGWGTPGEDYVTLATGRDFSDISPIRGVIHGGSQHTLGVAVTVEPILQDALT